MSVENNEDTVTVEFFNEDGTPMLDMDGTQVSVDFPQSAIDTLSASAERKGISVEDEIKNALEEEIRSAYQVDEKSSDTEEEAAKMTSEGGIA